MTPQEWQLERASTDALVKESGQLSQETSGRIDENELRAKARDEAVFAHRTSEGTLSADNDFVTPSMRDLADKFTQPFTNWLAQARARKNTLTAHKAAQERLVRALANPDKGAEAVNESAGEIEARQIADPAYIEAKARHATASKNYDLLKSYNGGRDARRARPILYYSALALIGAAEWFVNYETFLQKFVVFFAVATTIIVAAIVAINSDYVGTWIKQRKIARAMKLDAESPFMLRLTTIGFVIALLVIMWARFTFYAEQIGLGQETLEGGVSASQIFFVLQNIFPTLLINVLIWALGVVIAYYYKEAVPHFREEHNNVRAAAVKLEGFRRAQVRQAGVLAADTSVHTQARAQEHKQAVAMLGEIVTEVGRLEEVERQVVNAHAQSLDQVFQKYAILFASVLIDENIDPNEIAFRSSGGVTLSVAQWRARFTRS